MVTTVALSNLDVNLSEGIDPLLSHYRRTGRELAVAEAYRRIVAQAREPSFYAKFGVPDTLDGRFELVVLHAALVFRRLREESRAAEFAQKLFDHMFADMDQSIRELGVGDLSVGKHVKRMAQGFYGRLVAYDKALAAESDADLLAALRRNLYGTTSVQDGVLSAVAAYFRQQAADMAGQALDRIMAGEVAFGPPPRRALGLLGEEGQ